ncbi:fimbrillin family protein [uncultured Bacteroides sp.]|uniref:fimbrillin family protein n=1 Tax=uncultured Bacteroides sp. TaxID=162156 RepID=UPI0025E0EBD4|nr:fimbrillin family protein [uncultured Bacteroides sp.]
MKTINSMMALFAIALISACSQNEVTEVSPDAHPQVGFGVYTGASVRGVDMTNTSMQDDPTNPNTYGGFGIMGYFTGQKTFEQAKGEVTPSFMHNQMVEYKNGAWTYSPVKYWPNRPGDMISFFAYAPYEQDWQNGTKAGVVVSAAGEKGIPYINFTLKKENELKKMVDLVAAVAQDQTYTTQNDGKVSFKFEHTLSRVSFKAQLGDGDFGSMDGKESFVYITRMWIVGTDHTTAQGGNLSMIDPNSPANPDSKFYTKAKWSELHWNYGADAVIAKADFSLNDILDLDQGIQESNPTDGHTGLVKGIKITKDSQGTDKAVSLFPKEQFLYLIPIGETAADVKQNFGCKKGDIKIGFHYDIVTKDQTTTGNYVASHAESFIVLPEGHMQRNKSYVYTLKINLHEIKIDKAEVTPWAPITGNDEFPIE